MKGYIYLICDSANNLYKIGMTKGSIEKRIKELQTGNATELHIAAYHQTEYPYRLEKMLHNKYSSNNVHGEWFELTADETASFNDVCKEKEAVIESLKDNPYFSKDLK